MNTDTRELELRVQELERKLEALTEYCEDLETRITTMAVAKVGEPRFPYWNWQLCHRMSTEDRRRLTLVLSALEARAEGSCLSKEFQKEIEGVPNDLLYSDEPLQAAEAMAAIKAVTGMKHDNRVMELIEAVQGQGILRSLCAFMLAHRQE